MKIAAPGQAKAGPSVAAYLAEARLVLLVNLLLPDIRRIGDHGVQRRQQHGLLPASVIGNLAERLRRREIEKVASCDAGVVGFVVDFAGGQVQRRQVRRVKRNVAAE